MKCLQTVNVLYTGSGSLKRMTPSSAGFDLTSDEQKTLSPYSVAVVKTGVKLEMPPHMYAAVLPRSGLASKHGIVAVTGTIDSDYRGELCVILYNTTHTTFHVSVGDRIAQLVFHELAPVELKEVQTLSETTRGTNGFGSTGL
jgi:dUTP pyrophosphatase